MADSYKNKRQDRQRSKQQKEEKRAYNEALDLKEADMIRYYESQSKAEKRKATYLQKMDSTIQDLYNLELTLKKAQQNSDGTESCILIEKIPNSWHVSVEYAMKICQEHTTSLGQGHFTQSSIDGLVAKKEEEKENLQKQIMELNDKFTKSQNGHKKALESLQDKTKECEKWKKQAKMTDVQITEQANREVALVRAEHQRELERQNTQYQKELEKQSKAQWQQKLESAQDKVESLQGNLNQLKKLQKEYGEMEQQMRSQEEYTRKLEDQKKLEGQIQKLKGQIKDLEDKKKLEDQKKLEGQIQDLEDKKKLEDQKKIEDQKKLEGQIQKLKGQIKDLDDQNQGDKFYHQQELDQEMKRLSSEKSNALTTLHSVRNNLKDQITKLEKDLVKTRQIADQFKESWSAQNERVNELESEVGKRQLQTEGDEVNSSVNVAGIVDGCRPKTDHPSSAATSGYGSEATSGRSTPHDGSQTPTALRGVQAFDLSQVNPQILINALQKRGLTVMAQVGVDGFNPL